jgi:hypothetical protein
MISVMEWNWLQKGRARGECQTDRQTSEYCTVEQQARCNDGDQLSCVRRLNRKEKENVKVKVTSEQATKAQKWSRGLLFP